MKVLPLHPELISYLKQRRLLKKFEKQIKLFESNPFHPSLGTEILEPRQFRIYSFRIDRRYRAIFIYRGLESIEVIDINNHYK